MKSKSVNVRDRIPVLSSFPRSLACLLLAAWMLPASNAVAQLPEAPTILDFSPGGCQSTTEICGDGIDQDCNGSDLLCPPPGGPGGVGDADNDGYATGSDCDDTNRLVYPGISVACSASACGTGTKTCNTNGSFSSCSCTPLCEAVGSGRCFYVSRLTGSNNNPGSYASPFQTLGAVSSGHPSKRVDLRAGDVVYVMSGVYEQSYAHGDGTQVLLLLNVSGTASAPIKIKAYPGSHPVISPSTPGTGIYLLFAHHIVIEGIEISRAHGSGVWVGASSFIELRNLHIHDTDGEASNNLSGIYLVDTSEWKVHHSLIHDNYDRTNINTGGEKTDNSRNMVVFEGGNGRFHHNVVFHTPPISAPKTGACLTLKHALYSLSSTFEVDHNYFRNCWFEAIGTSSSGGRIHHNLILDSSFGVVLKDHGDARANLVDNVVEYNTMVNTTAMKYHPSEMVYWGNPFGPITFRRNIVSDTAAYDADNGGMISLDVYGSDSVYNAVVGNPSIVINENCYYNSQHPLQFGLFSGDLGAGYGLGALHTFSSWKSFFDSNSHAVNPGFDSNYKPTATQCLGFGHLGQ